MKNSGKTLSLIAIAIFVSLTFIQCTQKCGGETITISSSNDSTATGAFRIAYVNTDSLLNNYELAKTLNNELLRQEENMRANINERGKKLESEMSEFERKVKNNAFLSQERAEQEYQRILNKQQELQEYAQKLELEAVQNRQKMALRVNDSVQNYIDQELSKAYDIILSNASTLHVTNRLDITDEVIKALNTRYND